MTSEMFDSIDPSQIPGGQDDAGYVDGRWQTYSQLHGPHNLSIAVFASDDADAIDDEPGDATDAQLPGWVRREISLGHWRPVVYFAVSNSSGAAQALRSGGISRSQVRCWTAHYSYQQHLCGPACGLDPWWGAADATQWTDRSGGRNLDESTVADDFFNAAPPASPSPQQNIEEETDMIILHDNTSQWLLLANGKVHIVTPEDGSAFVAAGAKYIAVSTAQLDAIPTL